MLAEVRTRSRGNLSHISLTVLYSAFHLDWPSQGGNFSDLQMSAGTSRA